jgi:hypothetical protein
MSRPDIRIAIITTTVKGKAYLFTAIYFRTSPIKCYQIKNLSFKVHGFTTNFNSSVTIDYDS